MKIRNVSTCLSVAFVAIFLIAGDAIAQRGGRGGGGTNDDLIMETGIYNLTKESAEVLIHFGPEQTQEALLVRMEEPEQSSEQSGAEQ